MVSLLQMTPPGTLEVREGLIGLEMALMVRSSVKVQEGLPADVISTLMTAPSATSRVVAEEFSDIMG